MKGRNIGLAGAVESNKFMALDDIPRSTPFRGILKGDLSDGGRFQMNNYTIDLFKTRQILIQNTSLASPTLNTCFQSIQG